MRKIGSVLSLHYNTSTTSRCFLSTRPLTFEQINFPYGYVIYSTTIFKGSILDGSNIRDFGYIFVDDNYQGVISPNYMPSPRSKLPLKFVEDGSTLKIIVENRGRQTYKTINDQKGIIGDVFFDGVALRNWTVCGVDLDSLQHSWQYLNDEIKSSFRPGDIFIGELTTNELADTYLEPSGWGKGVVFINAFNIGKYWPTAGPQVTLYVPKPLLNTTNVVMLIDFESAPKKCTTNLQKCSLRFVDKPIYKTQRKGRNNL